MPACLSLPPPLPHSYSFCLSSVLPLVPPLSLASSFEDSPPPPDYVAPTMESSHCLRGLSLPSIAKYTPPSRSTHPLFLDLRASLLLPPFPSSSSLSCRSSYRCRPPLFPLFTALSCPPPGRLVARGSHYSWKWKLRWSLLVIVPPAWMAATRCFQRFFDVDASLSPFSFLSLPPPSASYAVIFPR